LGLPGKQWAFFALEAAGPPAPLTGWEIRRAERVDDPADIASGLLHREMVLSAADDLMLVAPLCGQWLKRAEAE
jgi:hypothetical protein